MTDRSIDSARDEFVVMTLRVVAPAGVMGAEDALAMEQALAERFRRPVKVELLVVDYEKITAESGTGIGDEGG